jgi:hypothetical protein
MGTFGALVVMGAGGTVVVYGALGSALHSHEVPGVRLRGHEVSNVISMTQRVW